MRLVPSCALGLLLAGAPFVRAQSPELGMSARAWAQIAAANQESIINEDGSVPLRYRVRKVDAKGDITREVIEAREGNVARLVARNDQPITAAEDAEERDRLTDILKDPESFFKHARHDRSARGYATQLVHSMAASMLWSFTPGQPQPAGQTSPQIVLDFVPDPKFKPPNIITEALTGISGRVWVDKNTRCVTRIDGQILHPIDFGWGGLLARVREGGRVTFEQRPAGGNRWLYSRLEEHINIREVLVRTVEDNTRMTAFDVRTLPAPISFRDAVQTLLNIHVSTR